MAEYSGTPLGRKLGFRDHFKIRVIHAPDYYFELLPDIPKTVQIIQDTRIKKNLIHYFPKNAEEFYSLLPELKNEIETNGMIWVSWPKKSSKVYSDLTEDFIRNYALKIGLVDIKICSVDDVWSGLKLVIPLKHRKFLKLPVSLPAIYILGLFLMSVGYSKAQKAIRISDNLAVNSDKLSVKLGSRGPGKIWKMHFGDYAVVSSKMGWSTTRMKENLLGTKIEGKSTEKFSFILSDKSADSARVNAANNITVQGLREIEILPHFSWGNNELIQESRNFSAFITINYDTTETWALFMHVAKGYDSTGIYEAFLTDGDRKIFISPVDPGKKNSNPFMQPVEGYEFFEKDQSLGALQYTVIPAMNSNIVWLERKLDVRMKLILAAAMTAILQVKISEYENPVTY